MSNPDAPREDMTQADQAEQAQAAQTQPDQTEQPAQTQAEQTDQTEQLDWPDVTRQVDVADSPAAAADSAAEEAVAAPPWPTATPEPPTATPEPPTATPEPPTATQERPTGPHAPAIVLGLVCVAVAGIVLAQELGRLTVDWGDVGPLGIVAAGAVLVLFGLLGLLTSRRSSNAR